VRDAQQTPKVAVAIVSWNTRDLLERCLESLEPEAARGLAEVWVVDNASTDGSPELVRERFGWVQLVASDENLGFGRAVNLVAERTRAEWIAPANADVALRGGALDELLAAGERDPEAGAIAPRLVLPGGETQHSVYAFPSIPFALVLQSGSARLSRRFGDRMALIGHWDSTRERRVPWAIAAFLLVRRAAWDAVGGFDERQWMYAEDLDIGWRLHRAGWPTRYVPGAAVDHESAASTTQAWGVELAPHWQRSTYGFMARRLGATRTRTIAAIYVLGTALRWIKRAPAAFREGGRVREDHRAWGRWVMVHVRALRDGANMEAYR
jgi:N-acetylglucosaminyl-diphospho-decaprenol L-rhamnosyltransferase